MTARWEEVLDAQLDLSMRLANPHDTTHLATEGYAQSLAADEPAHRGPGSMTHELPERLSAMVFNADPVFVDPDMQTVWEASIQGFKPEPLQPTDLITPAGFLLLPRPLYEVDVHGKRMSWRAFLWHPQAITIHAPNGSTSGGPRPLSLQPRLDTRTTIPVDRIDEDNFSATGILLSLFHDTRDVDDYSVDAEQRGIRGRKVSGLVVTHVMPWAFGEDWERGEAPPRNGETGSVLRPIQSLWRLMLQTIADVGHDRGPAPFRKRWERAGWPEKRVTVVRLRRPRQDQEREGDPKTVEWTHRWIVGGHWRQQWYPSVGMHRQIWISPFVKGPADKELVVNKARVFELVR